LNLLGKPLDFRGLPTLRFREQISSVGDQVRGRAHVADARRGVDEVEVSHRRAAQPRKLGLQLEARDSSRNEGLVPGKGFEQGQRE
jgi:hypothetical protein